MLRLSVGLFGDIEIIEKLANDLGRKGTENDIIIYNHNSSDAAMNFVFPKSDKIQSLLQAIAMIDIPVIIFDNVTPEVGEQLVALDMFSFEKGFVISKNMGFLKGTSLEKYKIISQNELREELLKIYVERKDFPLRIPVDNYFDVRSVGFIVLGIIKSGSVKKFDKLIVEPLGKEVLVKSIQSNDKEIQYAEKGTRVGLNIKGIDSEEMKRGFVLCNGMKKTDKISSNLIRSRFCKEELRPGDQIHVLSDLFFTTGTIEKISDDKITVLLQREIPCEGMIIFASTKSKLPRIVGKGFAA